MMVPKFRVWDETQHKMLQVDCIEFIDGKAYWVEASAADGNVQGGNDGPVGDNSQLKLEQFTGLKDANGNMIYENDIIKYFGGNERVKIKTTYGIVFYDSEHGCFNSRIQNEEHNKGGISPLDDLIVGNVHETPELLEAQHD